MTGDRELLCFLLRDQEIRVKVGLGFVYKKWVTNGKGGKLIDRWFEPEMVIGDGH